MAQVSWGPSNEAELIEAREFLVDVRLAYIAQRDSVQALVDRKKAAASQKNTAEQLAQMQKDQKLKEAKLKKEKEAEDLAKNAAIARNIYAGLPRLKRNGRRDGIPVIPQGVQDGRIAKTFPGTSMLLSRRFPRGLNRCYRTILHCVMHTPEWYHLMGNIHKDCPYTASKCITCALQHMTMAYWNRNGGQNELNRLSGDLGLAIKHVFTDPFDQDIVNEQQSDPFDLLSKFVRYVEREVTGVDPDLPMLPPIRIPEVNSNNFNIGELFRFDYTTHWTCGEDQPEGTASSFGIDINMHYIDSTFTIETYLEDLHMSQFIEVNPLRCNSESCAAQALEPGYEAPDQIREWRITKAPEILVLRLKRLQSETEFLRQKVDFGHVLDLSKFARDQGQQIRYGLRGTVDHSGGAFGGHYTAGLRCRALPGQSELQYCRVDDDWPNTRTYDEATMLDAQGWYPYVLVYSKLLDNE